MACTKSLVDVTYTHRQPVLATRSNPGKPLLGDKGSPNSIDHDNVVAFDICGRGPELLYSLNFPVSACIYYLIDEGDPASVLVWSSQD